MIDAPVVLFAARQHSGRDIAPVAINALAAGRQVNVFARHGGATALAFRIHPLTLGRFVLIGVAHWVGGTFEREEDAVASGIRQIPSAFASLVIF